MQLGQLGSPGNVSGQRVLSCTHKRRNAAHLTGTEHSPGTPLQAGVPDGSSAASSGTALLLLLLDLLSLTPELPMVSVCGCASAVWLFVSESDVLLGGGAGAACLWVIDTGTATATATTAATSSPAPAMTSILLVIMCVPPKNYFARCLVSSPRI